MDWRDFTDIMTHPSVPGETVWHMFTISRFWVSIGEKIGGMCGPLQLPVSWLIAALFWCFLVPLQALLAIFALLVRIFAGKGSFSHNLMMLSLPVGLFVAIGFFFGWDNLVAMLRAYLWIQ